MSHEVIDVCQDCGHLIEPEDVTAPWGARYRITLCTRLECLAAKLAPTMTPPDVAWAQDLSAFRRAYLTPVVLSPSALIRITGV